MTKSEIIKNAELITGDYIKYLKFKKYNSTFKTNIIYQIMFAKYNEEGYELTEEIFQSLNFFLNFDREKIEWIKKLSFEHYESCITHTDYGTPIELLEKHNNDYKNANKDLFKIYNPDESFEKSNLEFVDIIEQENDNRIDICLILNFSVPWESEHGMKIGFNNTEFIEVE
ncbi:hypothetical protein Q4Q34_02505 [Flavivirga abyssicola]|uniref:DUF6985 domain-containing protein n=1 Tax=Flavivirga abyssicola TaxID=3063533 RepID=UPI0026E0C59E|nr:hypothetical protein [Flavivirga sp. MEBiC07777]WVK13906.1 hypothetical protein Q4Q34_02505 [Flavivirga sp. MEBiC07777]